MPVHRYEKKRSSDIKELISQEHNPFGSPTTLVASSPSAMALSACPLTIVSWPAVSRASSLMTFSRKGHIILRHQREPPANVNPTIDLDPLSPFEDTRPSLGPRMPRAKSETRKCNGRAVYTYTRRSTCNQTRHGVFRGQEPSERSWNERTLL